jgi:hypothetical protein
MTMNDDFLTKFRKAPRPQFAASLYQRINKPMKTKSKFMTLRFASLTLSLLAVLTATLLFSPTVRALADTIIGQFSAYIFVQGTPVPVQQDVAEKKKSEVQSEPNKDIAYSFALDAAMASQLAGFTVLTPGYVPEGFMPSSIDSKIGGWRVTSKWGGQAVLLNFDNQTDNSFLVIEQLKIGQDTPMTVERPEIVAVTVRGLPGAWLPDRNDGKSALVWDENGITYSVISNKLPLEELQKVAESLGR